MSEHTKESFFNATNLVHYNDHYIEGGKIIAKKYSSAEFNPFKFSHSVPQKIVESILGKKNTYQPFSLYSLFASIDHKNTDQIIAWCNNFGFPQWQTRGSYPLDVFIGQVSEFQNVLMVADAVKNTSLEILSSLLYSMKQSNNGYRLLIPGNFEEIKSNPRLSASEFISSMINDGLRETIWPIFTPSNRSFMEYGWRSSSLSNIMYLMLGLDLSGNKFPITCQNKPCNHYFVPVNERNIYCSTTCKNSEQQRQHRLRKNQKDGE